MEQGIDSLTFRCCAKATGVSRAGTRERDPGLDYSGVRINEILSSNRYGLPDEEGDAEDWIELYNTGAATISLEGWSLTDDADQPGQWTFPAVLLQPGG